jgi:hypothetical protein
MTNPPEACLVAIFRNEGPYVLEWVAHHRAVGFNRLIVFTNGCHDGTDLLFDRLMALGQVIHAPNPKVAFNQLGVWQVAALRYAIHFGAFRQSEWVMTVDADEFVDIALGDGTLPDLLAAVPPFDLMSLTVLPFGSNGIDDIGDGRVHGRFSCPSRDLAALAAGKSGPTSVKTLMKPGIPKAHFRNHRPKIDGFSTSSGVWIDGSGRQMPADFTDRKVNGWSAEGAFDLAHVDHYSLRSRESFMIKCLRGDAVTEDRIGLGTDRQLANAISYWQGRNAQADTPHRPNIPPKAQSLFADYLSDQSLRALHEYALEAHRQNLAAILKTPSGAMLAERIGYRTS